QDKGNLKTNEQQKVETKVIESKSVIVVEQANPQVVYVPTYDPVVVYGPPIYPYPPIYYPPAWYYPAGIAISFGVGVMMGAFWSGGWGWGCGWGGHNDIPINRENNFNRNLSISNGKRKNNGARPSKPIAGGGNSRGPRAGETGAGWGVVTGVRLCRLGVAGIAGNIIPNIVEAPHTVIAQQHKGSEVRRAVIPSPTDRRMHDSRSAGKAAILAATRQLAAATGQPEIILGGEVAATALATVAAGGGRTASAGGTFRAVVGVIGMPSEAVLADITDRAHVPPEVAAPPAWDLAEVEGASAEVAADVAGNANIGWRMPGARDEIKVCEEK